MPVQRRRRRRSRSAAGRAGAGRCGRVTGRDLGRGGGATPEGILAPYGGGSQRKSGHTHTHTRENTLRRARVTHTHGHGPAMGQGHGTRPDCHGTQPQATRDRACRHTGRGGVRPVRGGEGRCVVDPAGGAGGAGSLRVTQFIRPISSGPQQTRRWLLLAVNLPRQPTRCCCRCCVTVQSWASNSSSSIPVPVLQARGDFLCFGWAFRRREARGGAG